MSDDGAYIFRRSASLGALSTSYGVRARASSDSGHHPPPFKPLRIIREHTFLDPAASADGMLRKTTETGNIGLFSIHAGSTTPLRTRTSLGDLRQPHRPLLRSSDRPPPLLDDRKKLPSYRDSASEIISMYGSENQSSSKSVSGTLSPPWDDAGQRSYSMTTCGSKGFTMPRSYERQQAQDFHARGQRPRSPYPYPTRLPRPGIRPSSPALTENGLVDYSRMVEIDRVPQRTTHHPLKTLFPYQTARDPRPLPLSLRYDVNQSTRSLSNDRDPHRPYPPALSRRPPLPDHLHPWGLGPRQRLGSGSSASSLRTMSLTSMNGGHGHAPPLTPKLPLAERKPIFYDYSEDFQDVVVEPPQDCPIAPTPKRISRPYNPGIVDDSCDTSPKTVGDDVRNTNTFSRQACPDGDDYCSGEQYRPVSQLEQMRALTQPAFYESSTEALTSSPESPAMLGKVDPCLPDQVLDDDRADGESQLDEPERSSYAVSASLTSDISTAESPLEPKTPAADARMPIPKPTAYSDKGSVVGGHDDGAEADGSIMEDVQEQEDLPRAVTTIVPRPDLASSISVTLPQRYSAGRRDSRFFSLSSGLSDLASFVKYVDRHIESPQSDDTDRDEQAELQVSKEDFDSHHGRVRIQNGLGYTAPPRKSSLCQHGTNYTMPEVNTATHTDELEQYQVVSTRSGPTLVPQPISPARMLRVKNSIPQLMKALPPLPEYDLAPDSPFGPAPMEFDPIEVSRLTDARSTLIDAIQSHGCDEEVPEDFDPYVFDRGASKPKLKLKHAASFAPGNLRNARREYFELADATPSMRPETRPLAALEYSTAPVKRRLPVKVPRPTLTSLAPEDTGTVKRRPGADKSSTVSELTSVHPVDLFSVSKGPQAAVQSTRHFGTGQLRLNLREQASAPSLIGISGARVRQVNSGDNTRGASLDALLETSNSPRARTESPAEYEMHSFFSDNSFVRPRRGLRKKISNLKSRLTENRPHQHSPSGVSTHGEHHDCKGPAPVAEAQATSTSSKPLPVPSQPRHEEKTTPVRNIRSRFEKFIQGARRKLRTWGKAKRNIA